MAMWGPIAMQAGGQVLSGIGGALSDKAKSKAAKQRLEAMQKALQMYQVGSTDALGNTLSAGKDGRWSYNLSTPTKMLQSGINKSMIDLGNFQGKNQSDYLAQNFAGLTTANNRVAQANQSAAMKNALRTGSNVGLISSAYNQANMQNMRNAFNNAYKNSTNWQDINANTKNNLATTLNNSMQSMNNIQGNLQNMTNSLNKTQMDQQNAIAGAQYDKTLAGRMTAANMFTAAGGAMSGYGANKQKQNNFNNYLATIKSIYGA
jgi:hypothetical protein